MAELAYRRFHCASGRARGALAPRRRLASLRRQAAFDPGERLGRRRRRRRKSASAVVWINQTCRSAARSSTATQACSTASTLILGELAGRYELREVMYDPWRFGQAAQELEAEGNA